METSEQKELKIVLGKQVCDNYPYGSLKCRMFFEVEFNDKKGFRGVTQSINPKTSRLNAPKKSVYSDFMVMVENQSNGHFTFLGKSIHGSEDIKEVIDLIEEYQIQLDDAQRKYIYRVIIRTLTFEGHYAKQKGLDINEYNKLTKYTQFLELYNSNAPLIELTKLGFDLKVLVELRN